MTGVPGPGPDGDRGEGPIRQVAVVAPNPHDAELIADRLWQLGVMGIEEFEGTNAETGEPSGAVCLVATPLDGDAERLAAAFPERTVTVLELAREEYESFLDAWQEFAEPVRAGERVVVWPATLSEDPTLVGPDDVVVYVFPGRAFGSGGHATTRLAIERVERHLDRSPGASVIDIGSGTGVLAVVAAALGAEQVIAVDLLHEAAELTRMNVAQNDAGGRVEARLGSTEVVADHEAAPLVIANLSAATLEDLAPELARLTAPGGMAVVTGILEGQEDGVEGALRAAGMAVAERAALDGWVVLSAARTGPGPT